MKYCGETVKELTLSCIPFEKKYYGEYREIYNDCFYEMRKSLGIRPYEFLREFRQIEERGGDIFLLLKDGTLAGAVTCRGNEIDDVRTSRIKVMAGRSFCGESAGSGKRVMIRLRCMWRRGTKRRSGCMKEPDSGL